MVHKYNKYHNRTRDYRKVAAMAAMMALLAAQPVWAAGPGEVSYSAPSGTEASAGVTVAAVEQAPSGSENTGFSPVIVAGQTKAGAQGQQPGIQSQQPGPSAAAPGVQSQQSGQPAAAPGIQSQPAAEADTQGQQPVQPVAAENPQDQAAEASQQQASSGRTIDPSKPMVALTFDDGPQASVGNRIMDCLAQYGGKATFFMVGERVPAFAAEVQRMVAEGHEVANHSMNHKYLQKLGAADIQSQVTRCNDAIESVCGVRPRVMRLPGGNHNATVLANTHMPMIQWNIDTLDWKTRNADKTVNAVLSKVKDGDIVLMHELYSQTGDAALRIIPELANRGFQMVTVSEMAAAKGYDLQAGKLYSYF